MSVVKGRQNHLLSMVLDVSYLSPGEGDLRRQLVVEFVNVQPKGIHSNPQLRSLLILNIHVFTSEFMLTTKRTQEIYEMG